MLVVQPDQMMQGNTVTRQNVAGNQDIPAYAIDVSSSDSWQLTVSVQQFFQLVQVRFHKNRCFAEMSPATSSEEMVVDRQRKQLIEHLLFRVWDWELTMACSSVWCEWSPALSRCVRKACWKCAWFIAWHHAFPTQLARVAGQGLWGDVCELVASDLNLQTMHSTRFNIFLAHWLCAQLKIKAG